MARRRKKLVHVYGPRVRLTSKGVKVTKPRARIGGKVGLNVSSRGVSGSVRTKAGTYHTKRGWTARLPGCTLALAGVIVSVALACALAPTAVPNWSATENALATVAYAQLTAGLPATLASAKLTASPSATPPPSSGAAAPTGAPELAGTSTPVPTPIALRGRGQTVTQELTLPSPISVARFTHDGQANFIVHVYQAGNQDFLINDIGPYQGSRPLRGGDPVTLEIEADGAWTVDISPVATTGSPAFSGKRDAVSGLFDPPESGPWEISHDGQSNFVVHLWCAGGIEFIENEIGPVAGSTMIRFPEGPCLWEVTADGVWSLTPRD